MPKIVHEIAMKLIGKKNVDNPWALATWIAKRNRKKKVK